jgi:hypothetical protein
MRAALGSDAAGVLAALAVQNEGAENREKRPVFLGK